MPKGFRKTHAIKNNMSIECIKRYSIFWIWFFFVYVDGAEYKWSINDNTTYRYRRKNVNSSILEMILHKPTYSTHTD